MTDTDLLQALPAAVYTTDAEGRITFFNEAAAELWGHRPELGTDLWCGSWRLFWPDGRPMAYDECPMAVLLREGRTVEGAEAIAERPDGTRVPFLAYPKLLKDASGRATGAINLLVDVTGRRDADRASALLTAIVASSDDAIVSKTLDGRITSWNTGAERIFGYRPDEIVGQPIMRIVPPELYQEEEQILAKIRRGERIEHFDTVRVTKDGRRIPLSVTISPVLDRHGNVIGASKVGRDVTGRKRAEHLQRLLFDELNHRVKNMLATIQAIASQSLRRAATPRDFVTSFNGRVQALARAHDLLVQRNMAGAEVTEIVREQVVLGTSDGTRIRCSGPKLVLDAQAAVQLALVLHELATNARKYGALSVPAGRLSIDWTLRIQGGRELLIQWRESGVGNVSAPVSRGFGTTLVERSFEGSGGEAAIRYGADGVSCDIRLPLTAESRLDQDPRETASPGDDAPGSTPDDLSADLRGKRILVVEDEAVVAMEIEAHLLAVGCEVVGPAGTVDMAMRLLSEMPCDAALVDANLAGRPVGELAAALTRKGIPFAFATGYGREALPPEFGAAPVLTKPFGADQLVAAIGGLLTENGLSAEVVSLRPKRV